MMRSPRHAWAAALILALSACGTEGSRDPEGFAATRDPSAFTVQEVDVLLAQEGISEPQRDVILRARKTGAVTFDDYQQAVMATIECLRDAGLNPRDIDTTTTGGQPIVTYIVGSSAGASEEASQQLIDACSFANSAGVEQLYARNPGAAQRAIEVQDAVFARAVTECLETNGYEVSDQEGLTWRDVAGKVLYEQTDNETVVCILDTGVAEQGINLPLP